MLALISAALLASAQSATPIGTGDKPAAKATREDIGAAPPPGVVRVSATPNGTCEVRWEGQLVDHDRLLQIAGAVPDKQVPIEITTAADTPFHCLGGVIYTLQKAGLNRLGFVAGPAANPPQS